MLTIVFIIFGSLLYFIGEGFTEGYTWSTEERRKINKFIRRDNSFEGFITDGFALGYHTYRVGFENLGLILVMVGFSLGTSEPLKLVQIILGCACIGVFVYERCFNLVSYGKLFPKKSPYKVFNFKFKRTVTQDFLLLAIGIVFFLIAF